MTEEEFKKIIENSDFVNLIASAQDDENLRGQLLFVLRSDDLNRQDTIKTWVHSCKVRGAPQSFIQALSFFMHREIAHAAIRLLD